ncbi:hypothetical protein OQA88_11408 [Cercophora sp. LCS_1]
MNPIEIPGYYYDAAKKRYFKIERDGTTPLTAEWAASNVKRRRKEEAEQADVRKRKDLRLQRRVKRAGLVERSLVGGALKRELGVRNAETAGEDGVKGWAAGLREKGEVMFSSVAGQNGDVGLMWVGGREGSDVGMVVGVMGKRMDETMAAYMVRDEDGKISNEQAALRYTRSRPFNLHPPFPSISSVARQPATNRLFFTPGTTYHRSLHIAFTNPAFDPDADVPAFTQLSHPVPDKHALSVHTLVPAPPNANLTAAIATSIGPALLHADGRFAFPKSRLPNNPKGRLPDIVAGDILSLALLPDSPSTIITGTRRCNIGLIDTRAGHSEWLTLHHPSPVGHLKPVAPFQILVAGSRSAMAVYDIRYVKDGVDWTRLARREPNRTRSVVEFVGYENEAHVSAIGLDVLVEGGGGGAGVVAAAQGDGRVGLWSLRDGMRLGSRAVEGIDVEGNERHARGWLSGRVVRCLQFARMEGERESSLYVGEGGVVRKYGFGGHEEEW